MKTYYIELTKKIVVPFEADSPQEAIDFAVNDDSGYDGAWERSEPCAEIIGVEL